MIRNFRGGVMAGCALTLLALAMGCKREASGQVAAVVNGEEITLQEINQEIGGTELPKNVDRKQVQRDALERIIDRRIIAQLARDEGIDREPDYIFRQRQMDELLLIQLFSQKTGRALRMPDTAALDKYIAQHPTIFANRKIYSIDRVQFPMPSDPEQLRQLQDDHSIDAVVAKLNTLGIAFKRADAMVDSASIPPQLLAQITALPPGEPFILTEGGTVTVSSIVGSKPAALSGADARPIAAQMMRNDELSKVIEQRRKTARSSAKIEYQPGFAPSKKTAVAPKP